MNRSAISQACTAWARPRSVEENTRLDDARALGRYGIFSNRNIAHITGLDPKVIARETGKTDRTGGRLNPASLPLLLDVAMAWQAHQVVDVDNVRNAVDLGTSWRMVSILTGIPLSTVHAKAVRR